MAACCCRRCVPLKWHPAGRRTLITEELFEARMSLVEKVEGICSRHKPRLTINDIIAIQVLQHNVEQLQFNLMQHFNPMTRMHQRMVRNILKTERQALHRAKDTPHSMHFLLTWPHDICFDVCVEDNKLNQDSLIKLRPYKTARKTHPWRQFGVLGYRCADCSHANWDEHRGLFSGAPACTPWCWTTSRTQPSSYHSATSRCSTCSCSRSRSTPASRSR